MSTGKIEHLLRAKRSDKRAASYVSRFGDIAAEVDALSPEDLRNRVEKAILSHIDAEKWEQLIGIEEQEKNSFNDAFKSIINQHSY